MADKDLQKEFLVNNVEQETPTNEELLKDFKEEAKEEEKLAKELDLDQIIANKIEEKTYQAMNAFEKRPIKSTILTLAGLFALKELIKYIKK